MNWGLSYVPRICKYVMLNLALWLSWHLKYTRKPKFFQWRLLWPSLLQCWELLQFYCKSHAILCFSLSPSSRSQVIMEESQLVFLKTKFLPLLLFENMTLKTRRQRTLNALFFKKISWFLNKSHNLGDRTHGFEFSHTAIISKEVKCDILWLLNLQMKQ